MEESKLAAGGAAPVTPRTLFVNGVKFEHIKATNFKSIEKYIVEIIKNAGQEPHRYAVVFDIDETILINDRRIEACDHARPNQSMMKIYKLCLRLKIAVFFVTARRLCDENYEWTNRQLQCIGAGKYKELHMCPESYRSSAAKISEFKKSARARITRKSGRKIILNAGDQWTDTLQMRCKKEADAFIAKDNKSYWLFQPIDCEVMWQLKLPDRSTD